MTTVKQLSSYMWHTKAVCQET